MPCSCHAFASLWLAAHSDCKTVFAEVLGNRGMLVSVDSVRWVLNSRAILMVELLHFNELARICAIIGDELSNHGNGLGAINLEISAWAEEIGLAQPVQLDVATVLLQTQAARPTAPRAKRTAFPLSLWTLP